MDWSADTSSWTQCKGCATIINGDNGWNTWCNTCCIDPKKANDDTNVRIHILETGVEFARSIHDRKLAELTSGLERLDTSFRIGHFLFELEAVQKEVQKEVQNLRVELMAPITAMQHEMQSLRESQNLAADAVQLQAQMTVESDLQEKLITEKDKFDAELNAEKVHASDQNNWEEWLHTHIITEIVALQRQVNDLNDGNKDRLADENRRQQEVGDLQHELRILKEALPPPGPPTSARPASPPQPPPLPPPQPQPPQPQNPVAQLMRIADEPRRQCCPMCRSTTDGTTCPGKPLPNWTYARDYVQLHWGQSNPATPLAQLFAAYAVEQNPTSWTYQMSSVDEMFFIDGGVDREVKSQTMRSIDVGLCAGDLEVIWHKTGRSAHIVFGLRCRHCAYMIAAEWGSPHKHPELRQPVKSLQLAFAYWLGVTLPETLSDAPQGN